MSGFVGVFPTPIALLGTLESSGTSVNNHSTGTAFNNVAGKTLAGKRLLLQPDAACHVAWGTANTVEASATTTAGSLELGDNDLLELEMGLNSAGVAYGYLAAIGTVKVKVWELPRQVGR